MAQSTAHQKSPERAFALQKYLMLHSQHDALHKHINQITSSSVPTSPVNSRSENTSPTRSRISSLSSSPESPISFLSASAPINTLPIGRQHHRSSISHNASPSTCLSRPQMIKRRSSLPAVIDEDEILSSIAEEEGKLKSVNEQIKGTLTDLLNCEGVRTNGRYRMWVQERLMNTEKELKGDRARSCEKRRRMSDAGGLSDSIGDHWK